MKKNKKNVSKKMPKNVKGSMPYFLINSAGEFIEVDSSGKRINLGGKKKFAMGGSTIGGPVTDEPGAGMNLDAISGAGGTGGGGEASSTSSAKTASAISSGASFAGDTAASFLDATEEKNEVNATNETWSGALSGAGTGAGAGATIGSAFGPIGTVVGGAAGAIIGGVTGGLSANKEAQEKKEEVTAYNAAITEARGMNYDPTSIGAFKAYGGTLPRFAEGGDILADISDNITDPDQVNPADTVLDEVSVKAQKNDPNALVTGNAITDRMNVLYNESRDSISDANLHKASAAEIQSFHTDRHNNLVTNITSAKEYLGRNRANMSADQIAEAENEINNYTAELIMADKFINDQSLMVGESGNSWDNNYSKPSLTQAELNRYRSIGDTTATPTPRSGPQFGTQQYKHATTGKLLDADEYGTYEGFAGKEMNTLTRMANTKAEREKRAAQMAQSQSNIELLKTASEEDKAAARAEGVSISKYYRDHGITPTPESEFQKISLPTMGNGGLLEQYAAGGDFSLAGKPTEYNGNTHAEGGIALGNTAEVEDGEIRVGDYIFSDQLITDKGNTFATAAKKITDKFSEYENDGPAMRTQQRELEDLKFQNDQARLVKQQADAQQQRTLADGFAAYGGQINKDSKGRYVIDKNDRMNIRQSAKDAGMSYTKYVDEVYAYGGQMGNQNPMTNQNPMPNQNQMANQNPQSFQPHMMHKNGQQVFANTYDQHLNLQNQGYQHMAYGGTMNKEPKKYYNHGGPHGMSELDMIREEVAGAGNQQGIVDDALTYSIPTSESNSLSDMVYDSLPTYGEQKETMTTILDSLGYDVPDLSIPRLEYKDLKPIDTPERGLLGRDGKPMPITNFGNLTEEEKSKKMAELMLLQNLSDREKKRLAKKAKQEGTEETDGNWGAPETALLATGAANLGTMMASALGSNPTTFDRVTKTPIKLDAQKKEVKASAERAKKTLRKNVRNTATSTGEALAALSAGNARIEAGENQMLNNISDKETLMNTQDVQNVKNINANISIKEKEAQQMDKAAEQTTLQNAITTLTDNIQGYTKDKTMTRENLAANKRILNMLNTGEYKVIPNGEGGFDITYIGGDKATKDVGKEKKETKKYN